MELCLHDPTQGYYATRSAIGGDFTTAPEISQLFGECIGVWVALTWAQMGKPQAIQIAECGPGRGVLMADIQRTLGQIAPDLSAIAEFALIEASADLRATQTARLGEIAHYPDLSALPDLPTIIIGNEFLDCLPARKYAKIDPKSDSWAELYIGLNAEQGFCFVPHPMPVDDFPQGVEALEVQPALEGIVTELTSRTAPFHALWIDYGPNDAPVQDSFRAYSKGAAVDPFKDLGAVDITVDVDFGRLNRLSEAQGLETTLQTQATFLLAHGLEARFGTLTAKANDATKAQIYAAARRLTHPSEMGEVFKAMQMWRH